jgi:predicted nucleic-acid-binding Zn-ribbon protein
MSRKGKRWLWYTCVNCGYSEQWPGNYHTPSCPKCHARMVCGDLLLKRIQAQIKEKKGGEKK